MNSVPEHDLNADALADPHKDKGGIRLLKVLTTFFHGGTERQVLNLARHMDRGLFDLRFACFSRDGDYLAAFEALQAPISEFRFNRFYRPRSLRQQLRFAAFLRRQRIQILHSYNFYANVFAVPAARLAGVPVVLASVRDRGVYLTPAKKRLQRWACGLADQVLVNADAIRDWLLDQGLGEDRITVIKNGIDLSPFQEAARSGGIRQEFGIPDSAPVVILLARLDPSKGIEDLIEAASLVVSRRSEVRFLIVGTTLKSEDGVRSEDHDYQRTLRHRVETLGLEQRVLFAGHRDDVPDLLAEADISVLPSHSEGLSNTILESMAAGLPVVVTDVGGNPELVQEGVNGRLVPAKSPPDLAKAIQRLIDNPDERQALGQRASIMAREQYSLPVMVTATQRLYDEQLRATKRSEAWL